MLYTAPQVTVVARPHFVEPPHLPVRWVGDAADGERLTEFAGRLASAARDNRAERTTADYLATLARRGDDDALAHASYTLLLEGVSRALADALARHAPAVATSRLAQRYVEDGEAGFVVPPAVVGDDEARRAWTAQIESAQTAYAALVERLTDRYKWVDDKARRRKLAREGARGVLPDSTETKLVCSASVRAWRALLARWGGEEAELEARRLVVAVVRQLQREAPALFGDFEVYSAHDRHEAARAPHPKG